MRYELLHFLSHVEDEQRMTSLIRHFGLEDFETFMHHLEYTSPATRERWLELCGRVLRPEAAQRPGRYFRTGDLSRRSKEAGNRIPPPLTILWRRNGSVSFV
ncbi:hypothetical protein ACHHV8_07020 [Paenibacillus sp. TAB 01]|uniref:hypothetical protein n=1 Tax=Paenibacillus sp. TAB 01 TaxID=3368988 RepID=UPI0037530AEB